MNDLVSLEGTRFNEAIRHNDGGSIFLGYLYAELTVDGALDDGEPLRSDQDRRWTYYRFLLPVAAGLTSLQKSDESARFSSLRLTTDN